MKLTWKLPEDKYVSDPADSGLQFTDVLFGFALFEVVRRFVEWTDLTSATRLHLCLATMTILGSYIGFRNSRKRGAFPLRFMNLATFRFALDQVMVFLYFWLALYFSIDKNALTGKIDKLPSSQSLLRFDSRVIAIIFVLYLAWDFLSHMMACTGKYLIEKDSKSETLPAKWHRTVVTLACTVVAGGLWLVVEIHDPAGAAAEAWLVGLIVLVFMYRVVKDNVQEKKNDEHVQETAS
jgi:hypothetical protein